VVIRAQHLNYISKLLYYIDDEIKWPGDWIPLVFLLGRGALLPLLLTR
jgi:hypothetical protein